MEIKQIHPKLVAKLNDIASSFVKTEYIKTTDLVRMIRSVQRTVRHFYKYLLPYEKTKGADRLFSDSYYKLEQVCAHLLKSLKKVYLPSSNKNNDVDLFSFFKVAVNDNELHLTDESLSELVDIFEQKNYMKSVEFDFLFDIILLSSLFRIRKLIKNGNQDYESLYHAVGIIYSVEQLDIKLLIQNKNRLEQVLKTDPAGVYQMQSEKTNNHYRYMISRIARLSKQDELMLTRDFIAKALASDEQNHVGFPLYHVYEAYTKKELKRKIHLKSLYGISIFMTLAICLLTNAWFLLALIFLPVIEIIRPMIEYFLLKGVEQDVPPRYDFLSVVPKEHKTLVVVSTLVPEINELSTFKAKLERLMLCNNKGAIYFVVLADLKQAKEKNRPNDKDTLNGTDKVIKELNRLYDDKLLMLVRKREYSKTQNAFIGRERKRGAISDLVQMIKGEQLDLEHSCGDMKILEQAKYMMTLDYDTGVLLDSIAEFVELAAHPINQPVIDRQKGIVTSGYGIISPKISLDLKETFKSIFTRVMGGIGGTSYYETGCSDLYQDVYHNAIFTGKGLINIDAFASVLHNRFTSETVLSHDIIEGLFLRVLYARDVEIIDGFPSHATAFFKRMHRWIRGDFQNISFLFKKQKNDISFYQNQFSSIDKYKLIDNLRREITPVFSLLCIFVAGFVERGISGILLATGILAVISPYLFSLIIKIIRGSITAFTTRTYSKTLPITTELMAKALFAVMLLPQFAFVALDAAFRAIYRRFISKKNLLQWVTAAQVQGQANSIENDIKYYLPCILSTVVLCFSPYLSLKIGGLLFAMAIPLVSITGKKAEQTVLHVPKDKREVLTDDVKRMLMFYNDYCNEENNFLPPDNVQFAPVYRVAQRTSPTNIGLMLLSMLTARDLDFITTDRLYNYCTLTIQSVERLEKFHGNLFNWYDTTNLKVLEPAFASTVDSGNLVCCLVCLKEGLKEYQHEHQGMIELICRVEKLIEATDLAVFFNKKKMLFSIGYDRDSQSYSNSNYDMLMSEARMTSYFAVAKGLVQKKHWGILSRTLSRQDCCHTGPMSWTGTMFEYFMPELLLQCFRGSLGFEGLKYCVHCQKSRAKKLDIPYGISECGIYQFDSELNYQYQANGTQRLALKRGMNDDLCVAPYATYLTLSLDFEPAFDNLKRLDQMHMKDKYGFFEAVDYTTKRVGENELQVIKSFMAHHIGMSVVAVNNALNQNIMQKRFLRDKDMSRATELLQEKMQVGEVVFFDQIKREKGSNPEKSEEEFVGQLNPSSPKVKVLNNGEVTSIVTDIGASYIQYHKTDITRRPTDLLRNSLGTFCFVLDNTKDKDKIRSLTYAPSFEDANCYEASFGKYYAKLYANFNTFKSVIEVIQHYILPCEQRKISIKNQSNHPIDTSMLVYLEPALLGFMDDATHKTFSKLFINISYDEESNTIIATRKKRSNEAITFMAVGFREDISFEVESNRENVFERGNVLSVNPEIFTKDIVPSTGVPDPCIAIRLGLQLQKGEHKQFTLLTSVATSKADAIMHIQSLRESSLIDERTASKSKLEHGSLSHRISAMILPRILFQKRDSGANQKAIYENTLGITALWSLGISGDLPIVLVEVFGATDMERVRAYSVCHSQLKLCGIEFDLVFLHSQNENDTIQTKDAIMELVVRFSGHNSVNQKGGIYLIDKETTDEPRLTLLQAVASHTANRSLVRIETPTISYIPIVIQNVSRERVESDDAFEVIGGFFSNESFFITQTPKLPWCHILANPTFGTLLSDKALGFTWAINARENKLTPWYNDTRRENNGEMVLLKLNEKYYDLVNGSTAQYHPQYAAYHGKLAEIQTKVTVTVPKRGMIKYVTLEIENHSKLTKEVDLCYYTEPVLAVNRDKSHLMQGEFVNNTLLFQNQFTLSGRAFMGITAYHEQFDFTCDRQGFFNGVWDSNTPPPMQDLCGAITVKKQVKPNETIMVQFALCFAATKQGVLEQLKQMPQEPFSSENKIQVKTGDDAVDALVNTWLPHQILHSRLYGRTGFYQCGGAYGFRDQLQDVCAYMLLSPKVARTHIIRCCASQFEEGDVFHWWHTMPMSGGGKKGVRTHYSDDLIWLPYTVVGYVKTTGDTSVLDVKVKFLVADEVPEGKKDCYLSAAYSEEKETVYEHCKRALERAYHLGEHGLPKIGSGDWNDGYSNVGIFGFGESVWLAQFLSLTLKGFAEIAVQKGEQSYADECQTKADELLEAVDKHCYDKDHYIRAFYDNGDMMGSYQSEECRIDSLTQSFSALSNMPDKKRVETALKTAYDALVDHENGIIKLFTSAFDHSKQDPGYVKAYPRGVRENGGQYTHAAVWQALAMHKIGALDEFHELTSILNPIRKYLNQKSANVYQTEPYYMTADIYTNENSYGRSGWSLYTGSSGWYYQLLVCYLLGINPEKNKIIVKPTLPKEMKRYEATISIGDKQMKIAIKQNEEIVLEID